VYDIIMKNKEELDSAIIYDRDYNYDYFGFKTLERSYLLRVNGKIAERPQVACMMRYPQSSFTCMHWSNRVPQHSIAEGRGQARNMGARALTILAYACVSQHMLMRVAVGIHKSDIAFAIETYNYMSQKFFTHARLVAGALAFPLRVPIPQVSAGLRCSNACVL